MPAVARSKGVGAWFRVGVKSQCDGEHRSGTVDSGWIGDLAEQDPEIPIPNTGLLGQRPGVTTILDIDASIWRAPGKASRHWPEDHRNAATTAAVRGKQVQFQQSRCTACVLDESPLGSIGGVRIHDRFYRRWFGRRGGGTPAATSTGLHQ